MEITKISIKHYRTCEEVVFTPHPRLSVLIGPNGSGKTNIFSAIKLLPALCYEMHRPILSRLATSESFSTACEIKTWYKINEVKISHIALLNLVTNENNQDEIIASEESWFIPTAAGGRKKVSIPSMVLWDYFRESEYVEVSPRTSTRRGLYLRHTMHRQDLSQKDLDLLEHAIRLMSGISYYSASQFTNPGNCPISFEVEKSARQRTGISITGHKWFLYDMYQEERKGSDAYKQFKDLVGLNGIGLIEDINFNEIVTSTSSYRVMTGAKVVKREKENLMVVPSFKISGNNLSPSQLSEGTFKTLALIFYLVTDKNSILIIEEPEVCVHHGLLNSIIDLIQTYSEEKQIFVSTHSDSVLDKLSIENIFKVKRAIDKGTTVTSIKRSMKNIELSALKKYLLNEGSLGEFWKLGDLENV